MVQFIGKIVAFTLVGWLTSMASGATAGTVSNQEAWGSLPQWQDGQDMSALLQIDCDVIRAMGSPTDRARCAARLGEILQSPNTTLAAKRYICLQLRQVGTPAEVPALSVLLKDNETSQMARYALEAISGEAASRALREAIGHLQGDLLVGVVGSLGAKRDPESVIAIDQLVNGNPPAIRDAACKALAEIATEEAVSRLVARDDPSGGPTPGPLVLPLLRCAARLVSDGKASEASAIYHRLSEAGQPSPTRQTALRQLLKLGATDPAPTIMAWFRSDDLDRREVAVECIHLLSDNELNALRDRMAQLPAASQLVLIEVLATRGNQDVLPLVLKMVHSDAREIQLAGIRLLPVIGDESVIELLVDCLALHSQVADAARRALACLPRQQVGPAMLKTLQERPDLRPAVIQVLKDLTYYEAIDPLIDIATDDSPETYALALDGLRGIADPDSHDIPRLLELLRKSTPGQHRDEVEKTILIVCHKLPASADRARPVLDALAKKDASLEVAFLPLLGRLGSQESLDEIDAAIKSPRADVEEAGMRALCNWPNADVADRLMNVVETSDDKQYRRWALRAVVRVISMPSQRPLAQTLGMLRTAMQRAEDPQDRQLIVDRAGAVRSMEAVTWIAQFLDEPELAQAACRSLVELAHHRELRQPNKVTFDPILEKVARISHDAEIVDRARRYRLGL